MEAGIMTLQEIIKSLDNLSAEEQSSLLDVLRQRRWHGLPRESQSLSKESQMVEKVQANPTENAGEIFWQGVVRFRETIEKEGILFADEDFSDLRDRSPGREIEL
jgi:hypothetical protein